MQFARSSIVWIVLKFKYHFNVEVTGGTQNSVNYTMWNYTLIYDAYINKIIVHINEFVTHDRDVKTDSSSIVTSHFCGLLQ